MKTDVCEIAEGVFRLSIAPDDEFEFSHFLIVDRKSMLIHTGSKKLFGTLRELVGELIDYKKLNYIAFSHFESDECGALNDWLQITQNSIPLVGKIGKATMDDFSGKEPEILTDGQILDLGRNKIQMISTPHIPHGWESVLFFEITNKILFSSDIGAQPGINPPVTSEDISKKIIKFMAKERFIPAGKDLTETIERIENLGINYLAPMHGSVIKGEQIKWVLKAIKNFV